MKKGLIIAIVVIVIIAVGFLVYRNNKKKQVEAEQVQVQAAPSKKDLLNDTIASILPTVINNLWTKPQEQKKMLASNPANSVVFGSGTNIGRSQTATNGRG